ncbi:MAG: Unknown protein [uncultured Campylobacterales bacterium]|uniref:Uncharacterized protein n=1 Tax=uncultured Campylobacterales bacterium TaxID=352960 RepID=A0A6S6SNR4_9BACT|nr:MAG: Unknown protein [uncultured Campylobacterales bacterium]
MVKKIINWILVINIIILVTIYLVPNNIKDEVKHFLGFGILETQTFNLKLRNNWELQKESENGYLLINITQDKLYLFIHKEYKKDIFKQVINNICLDLDVFNKKHNNYSAEVFQCNNSKNDKKFLLFDIKDKVYIWIDEYSSQYQNNYEDIFNNIDIK